ncbi:negative regulation of centrosome duplication [Trichomonas vaginalis G3]|uniref:negative regulation of centrosome duplication n=1 Tax=Trichomonas vaginalis (strain ATCC PRA-98 / G3) TaxID=412133 RepID=UPI0021E58337|nr:negative regulation of centrosome duplication [Trichomonas vaginalis G3]KAI5520868.1 negative regulation of centrosome duplication [Trichomonas vaginalis G3]
MFFFLFFQAKSAMEFPLLDLTCEDGYYWSVVNLTCEIIPENYTLVDTYYLQWNSSNWVDTTTNESACITAGGRAIAGKCVTAATIQAANSTITGSTAGFDADYVATLQVAYVNATNDPYDSRAREILANSCTLNHYETQGICQIFYQFISASSVTQKYGYRYWPDSGIFLKYTGDLDQAIRENVFTSDFQLGTTIKIWLARYGVDGTFKGFRLVYNELQYCHESIDIAHIWKNVGYNYMSDCLFNLDNFVDTYSNELYDIYVQDGETDSGIAIIRPIPVVDSSNSDNADARDNGDITPGRRFFIHDNTTREATFQYATEIRFSVGISSSDTSKILVPYINLTYSTSNTNVLNSTERDTFDTIVKPTYGDAIQAFQFEVRYTIDNTEFWRIVTIIFFIVLILGLGYLLVYCFFYGRTNGEAGMNSKIIMKYLSAFFNIFGTVLFLIVWVFSFYLWCFFKLQKSTHTALLDQKEYDRRLIPCMWIAFVFKVFASFLQVYVQSTYDIFIIDWESPRSEASPISTWRRIMIANEWNRIIPIRSYNFAFTLITLVFLLNGFDWVNLSSPIPITKYLDTGEHYKILIIALTTALFVAIIFIQYIWNYWIRWRFFGNPFYNFLDLCSNANLSVLIMESPNHGHYLHGRSLHTHSDDTMAKLNENLEDESKGLVGTRGLLPNTTEQCFEVLFNSKFMQKYIAALNNMDAHISGLKVRAKMIQPTTVKAADDMNTTLKAFFDNQHEDKFQVIPMSVMHQILRYTPVASETTLLAIESEASYSNLLLSGIEWKLATFYIIMFTCIEIHTRSPGIAAFCVYIVDFILVTMYYKLAKNTLAKKSLLDDRFLL